MNNEVARSIQRTPALGWQMFNQMNLVGLVTPSGIYLGKKTVYKIIEDDGQRIDRIVIKIIKGLFYNQFKKTIPSNWLIKVYWITPRTEKELDLRSIAKTLRWDVIRDDTFAYGFNFVPDTYQSIWIMDFFKIPLFYVMVLDPKTAKAKNTLNH